MQPTAVSRAIKEAIKEGYVTKDKLSGGTPLYFTDTTLLNPLFWQALGRARRWDEGQKNHDPVWQVTYNVDVHVVIERWANVMLDFTYYLAEGKDAESFFQTLV